MAAKGSRVRTHLVTFLISLGVTSLLTPMVLRAANRLKLYDQPDGERKIHVGQIPRLGGIAIALGFVTPLIALLFWKNDLAHELQRDPTRTAAFFGGFAAIVAVGLVDDLRGLGAWSKLGVQVAVGVGLWAGGLSFNRITLLDVPIELGLWSLPFTVIWVAAIVNAMNLIDGLDGLAAGVGFFAAFSLFTIALLDGNTTLALFAAAIGGSVVGFLLYNFSPALIFMGDTGSMAIGYVFAACALWSASKRSTTLSLVLPIVALGVPILDTSFAFIRRAASRRSPFSSDRGHIHHRLLDVGLSQRQAVLAIYLICVVLTAVAIMIRATDDLRWAAAVVSLGVAMAGVAQAMRRRMQLLAERGADGSAGRGGKRRSSAVDAAPSGPSEPPASR